MSTPLTTTAPVAPAQTLRQSLTADSLRARLLPATAVLPRWGWLLPAFTVLLGGLLRFFRLGEPHAIVFDETYYVKDAYSLLHYGYERDWPENADELFVAGTPPEALDKAAYVVHGPMGKWMIAAGMALFGGDDPVGWRFSSALVGTLSIALVCLAAWLLFRSLTVATLAGAFTAVDGLHLVQSRLALLDVFLMFFLLLAFVLLLLDRQDGRRRLVGRLSRQTERAGTPETLAAVLSWGPWLGIRWCRIAAGVACGAAASVKWNALFVVAALGVLTVLWDMNARRVAGIRHWFLAGVVKDGLLAFVSLIGVGLVAYLTTWWGWFASAAAYHRNWAAEHPGEGLTWLPAPLRSLWEYHRSAYSFHSGLSSEHTYESPVWQWLFLGRPTSYYYEAPKLGEHGCTVDSCSEAILNIGNPLLWWTAVPVLLVALWMWVVRRDWRFAALLGVFAAGYLPWYLYPERTMFFFYALVFLPYLMILLAGVLGMVLGRPGDSVRRRQAGAVVVGGFLAMALLVSVFYLPIWYAETIPYEEWRWRMWFDAWI